MVPVYGSLRSQSVGWGYKPTIACRTGTLPFAFNSALAGLQKRFDLFEIYVSGSWWR